METPQSHLVRLTEKVVLIRIFQNQDFSDTCVSLLINGRLELKLSGRSSELNCEYKNTLIHIYIYLQVKNDSSHYFNKSAVSFTALGTLRKWNSHDAFIKGQEHFCNAVLPRGERNLPY